LLTLATSQVAAQVAGAVNSVSRLQLILDWEFVRIRQARDDHTVPDLEIVDGGPNFCDDADRLVTKRIGHFGSAQYTVVDVKVGAADRGCSHAYYGICGLDDLGLGDIADGHIEGLAFPHNGPHGLLFSIHSPKSEGKQEEKDFAIPS
jgi:hypothetical protein